VTKPSWRGLWPAVTTQFQPDQSIDFAATARHVDYLIRAGSDGLIMLGTVGENTALEAAEKRAVVQCAIEATRGRVPVLSGVAEYTTPLACRYAAEMETLGIQGLMVLPAMVYKSDARESIAHFRDVARASALPVMVYNNPISYGVDVTPEMFVELAQEPTIVAIKESSDNIRRLTDLIAAVGDRFILFAGVDDLALESFLLGAVGWVSGLANAFPVESAQLFKLARAGRYEEARAVYRWLMPVLHLDTHPKLVQYIKLAQALAGLGTEWVRAPRLPLVGEERAQIEALIRHTLDRRPQLAAE
jgi:4-hydroxy-tetrahydrodipicolinate synthase